MSSRGPQNIVRRAAIGPRAASLRPPTCCSWLTFLLAHYLEGRELRSLLVAVAHWLNGAKECTHLLYIVAFIRNGAKPELKPIPSNSSATPPYFFPCLPWCLPACLSRPCPRPCPCPCPWPASFPSPCPCPRPGFPGWVKVYHIYHVIMHHV